MTISKDVEAMKEICEQLSLLQIKKDCATMLNITKYMNGSSVLSMGVNPYLSIIAASILESFEFDEILNVKEKGISLEDLRLKAKLFENGYSKSKRMILNIDYLQDEFFKRQLRFKFLGNMNIHYNLGIYATSEKHIVFNTQLTHYALQDNRFLKKSYDEVVKTYSSCPELFDFSENGKRLMYEHGVKCGQLIGAAYTFLGGTISANEVEEQEKSNITCYADYNTNRKSELFPDGENSKAIVDDHAEFLSVDAKRRATLIVAKLLSQCNKNELESFAGMFDSDYMKLDEIDQLKYWTEKVIEDVKAKEIKPFIEDMHKKMCDSVIECGIDLYDDKYYKRHNIWGLIRCYKDDEIALSGIKKYMLNITSKDNVYRVLWDLTSLSIGRVYRYNINKENFATCFEDEAVIDNILNERPPKTEDEAFVLDIYNEYRHGDNSDIYKRGIYSTEQKNLNL